jgi:uncharacterized membrane protein
MSGLFTKFAIQTDTISEVDNPSFWNRWGDLCQDCGVDLITEFRGFFMTIKTIAGQFIFGIILTFVIIYFSLSGQIQIFDYMKQKAATISFHGPDLAYFAAIPLIIKIHLLSALGAFVLGIVQFIGKKGVLMHRILGWSWVVLMLSTAITSAFIQEINPGHFTFIHLFTVLTLVTLPMAVLHARKKRIKAHASAMTGLFIGALVVAGLFTFMPGRTMWNLFFG